MTKKQQIKGYITNRFNHMTYDEYLCHGTGTLSILDEAISKYDTNCELDDNAVAKLAEYCNEESTKFSKRFAGDDMPYCTRLAEKCAQRLFKDETIKED